LARALLRHPGVRPVSGEVPAVAAIRRPPHPRECTGRTCTSPKPRLRAGARREAILAAAMSLFARDGLSGVTTREIAAAAGISEAILYRHFPGKEDLYAAILRRNLDALELAMPARALARSAEPPGRFLRAQADAMLARIDADPSLLRLLLHGALEGHPLARDFDRGRGVRVRAALATYFRRQVREGRLRRVDPEVAARAWLWMVVGIGLARTVFREPGARRMPRDRIAKGLVDLFLHGASVGGASAGRVSA
jgi:AcrR family transcriptional regulator